MRKEGTRGEAGGRTVVCAEEEGGRTREAGWRAVACTEKGEGDRTGKPKGTLLGA